MTQEFLNKEKLPFKDCSREEQHILLDALLDGTIECYEHLARAFISGTLVRNIDVFNLNAILRTKPVKHLAIPWEHIKPEYRWAAMDENGIVIVYRFKPKISTFEWKHTDNDSDMAYLSLSALNIDTAGIDWRDSLVERPANK